MSTVEEEIKSLKLLENCMNPLSGKVINEYEKTENPLRGINYEKETEEEIKDKVLASKRAAYVKSLVKRVANFYNARFPDKKINLTPTFSCNIHDNSTFPLTISSHMLGDGVAGEIHNIPINLKAHDILYMPIESLYVVILASVAAHIHRDKVYGKGDQNNATDFFNDYRGRVQSRQEIQDELKKNKNRTKAKLVIKSYLQQYFKNFCRTEIADKFKDIEPIAEFVALELLENLDDKDIEKLLNGMFTDKILNSLKEDAEKEAIDFINIGKASDDTEFARAIDNLGLKAYDSRMEKSWGFVSEKFKLGSESTLPPHSSDEQAKRLQTNRVADSFKKMQKSSIKNGIVHETKELRDFCKEYIDQYMSSNGLKSVRVTFNTVDKNGAPLEMGTFFDSDNPRINVNLGKVKSISEFMMTLSHELAHAVDSLKNKLKVAEGKEIKGVTMSRGLADYISEDMSVPEQKLKNNPKALAVLRKISNLCYKVNPNERNARVMELSAIRFMKNIAKDPASKKQLEESVASFVKYQTETENAIKDLRGGCLDGLETALRESGVKDEEIWGIFNERKQYLEDFLARKFERNLEDSLEPNSVEEVKAIMGDESKSKKIDAKKADEAAEAAKEAGMQM